MKDRHIKVYEAPVTKRNIPRILLQGEWLSQLGYHVGDQITVRYDQDKLLIELAPTVQE